MPCYGNAETHCCWLEGKECQYVEENTVPGRRWACGLMRRYGDWDAVLASPEYAKHVKPTLDRLGINCRDWPDKYPNARCMDCGYG